MVTAFGAYWMYRSHVRTSGLQAAQQWARTAPLPNTATNLHVDTRGGLFTREFTIRFHAPPHDVNAWLNESPGTSTAKPTVNGNIRVYSDEPGGGAMHAEVTVDNDSGAVTIHTFWS
jgi:hypothetical protein